MEEKGDALMTEGEKNLKKFSLFSSNDDKVDKAHEKFMQAATQYKAAGNFGKAAKAYARAGEMSKKNKNEGEMCMEVEESAKAFAKAGDVSSAVSRYKEVVEYYDKNQKFVNAAKACVELGELCQGNEAMQWLQRAVKYYKTQGSKVTASEIVEKMANVKANSGDYAGSREIYDELARDALDDRVSRGNARKLFFSSLLAQIAGMTTATLMEDVGVLQERFEEYQELDTQFNQNTREHMLISALIDAIQSEDPDAFESAVTEYDSICPLDAARQKMLLKGKQVLRAHANDLRIKLDLSTSRATKEVSMLPVVLLLHSADGKYSDTLVSGAIACATAIARSVTGSSPDFIPLISVLRADPVVGVRYLYTASVPDTNHAVDAGEVYYAPFSPSLAHVNDANTNGGERGSTGEGDARDVIRGRSLTFLSECIAGGTRVATAVDRPGEDGDEDHSGDKSADRPGAQARARKRLRQDNSASTPAMDPWATLAAGVLTALTVLHKRAACANGTPDTVGGSRTTTTTGLGRDALVSAQRSVVVIFSDCMSVAPLPYSTECAMAVATLGATKGNVGLFCFGEAVTAEVTTMKATVAPGAMRLRAMTSSTGGFCARQFSYSVLGFLLDGGQRHGGGEKASQPTSARGRRERIADQYVVCPTVLARAPDPSGAEVVSAEGDGNAHDTKNEHPSNLGWLCPQCMAVVCRYPGEAVGGDANGDVPPQRGESREVYCPYCV